MFSETDIRGTVCGKSARTGLWGSGEVTNRSTRKKRFSGLSIVARVFGSFVAKSVRKPNPLNVSNTEELQEKKGVSLRKKLRKTLF
jgi:hypothetical protein